MNSQVQVQLTDVVTMALTALGAKKPQMLATQFVSPIIVPA